MRAAAPGKLVLSGAYSVLEGAPALVTAVSRYAVADTGRCANVVTDEVAAAIAAGELDRAPWFDASALREEKRAGAGRKLGLGSSAAILVASLGAVWLERGTAPAQLGKAVFVAALAAHRHAQGGGSGIDVAASCYGGVLCCEMEPRSGRLDVRPHGLPPGLVCEVWAAPESAATRDMLAAVQRLRRARRALYRARIETAAEAARAAAQARRASDLVGALDLQFQALAALGEAAGAAIAGPAYGELRALAAREGAAFGPSGAGGGDVSLFIGQRTASSRFRARARAAGLSPVSLRLGAEGVHPLP
ncbi:MAG: hypothetical protein HY744_33325 [Deltaproteobacteria bacterium]|nr:hypothetical protein [Deltaproteobacteria bacterium]